MVFEVDINNLRQIVWLASYPKSGNTWVRLFLQAYITGESDINNISVTFGDDAAGLYNIGDGMSHPHEYTPEEIIYCRPMALLRLVRLKLQDASNKLPLIIKSHAPCANPNGIELLPEGMTRATVHIVRDPRDVVPSYATHFGMTIDEAIIDMGKRLKVTKSSKQRVGGFLSSWDLHTRSFLDTQTHNIKTWRYEDLRHEPAKHFASILEHIGLQADKGRINMALDLCDISRLRKQEQDNGFREASPKAPGQFFGTGDVGGWRNKLTESQAVRINNAFERQMRKIGYDRRRRAA